MQTQRAQKAARTGARGTSPIMRIDGHGRAVTATRTRSKGRSRAVAIVPIDGHVASIKRASIVDLFLASKGDRTRAAYRSDLRGFATWGQTTPPRMVERLLLCESGPAHELVIAYRSAMLDQGLSSATIARRLATLRSLTRLAKQTGRISWGPLDVAGPKVEAYRDTKGPGIEGVQRLLTATPSDSFTGARDQLVLRLAFDLALRRFEIAGLDLAHVDAKRKTVSVLGKGKRDRLELTLPAQTVLSLRSYLRFRGDEAGPLLWNMDPCLGSGAKSMDRRLSTRSIQRVVNRASLRAGLDKSFATHALRHASVTAALDAGLDPRTVMRHSRHARLDTLLLYDDRRNDSAGEVASAVAALAKAPAKKPRTKRPLPEKN